MTRDMLSERYIERNKMPQIQSVDLPGFLAYLSKKNVNSVTETVPAGQLIQMQRLNSAKVEELKNSKLGLDKPILVSRDYKIIDGHHRWAAARDTGVDCSVIKLSASFDEILDVVKGYNKVFYKGINESDLSFILVSQFGNEIHARINGVPYTYIVDGDPNSIFKKTQVMAKVSGGKALNYIKKQSIDFFKEEFFKKNTDALIEDVFDLKKKKKKSKTKIQYNPDNSELHTEDKNV